MKHLETLIYRTQLQFQLNALLKGLGIGIGMLFLYFSMDESLGMGIIIGAIMTMFFSVFFGVLKTDRAKAKNILHLHYPELEFSLDILDKENKNIADFLQLQRLESQFRQKKAPIVIGQRILPILLFLLGTSAIFGITQFDFKSDKVTQIEKDPTQPAEPREEILLKSVNVEIQPPAYTGQKAFSQQDLDVSALEGASITWTLDFNLSDIGEVYMIDGLGQEVKLEKKEEQFQFSDQLVNSGIYAFKTSTFQTDFYQLEMEKDKAPLINPDEEDLYKYHFQKDPKRFDLKARVSDDFLVREVYLIATLARGSGENVKFRERKFSLNQKNFQSTDLVQEMDLEDLDFQPGDELYYYWLAIDNKRPEANISKSDTYFIQFVDSTGMTDAQLEGMAIHVLPDYFRSQRQIIIDTEKLIASQTSEQKFNEDSNELGYEQKLLRMRYGQYLGEEFESNAPGGTVNTVEGRDILESFMHNHDHEGENEGDPALITDDHQEHQHGQGKQQIEGVAGADEHDHQHDGLGDDAELSSLLEDYLHNHDSEEMNTFYEGSTRSMLKMALEMMWQSELHLRLFEPEKALPFQRKALEYLKSVQQKSRTYVKKSGFDPPPIKVAEKRLTGETETLNTRYKRELSATQKNFPLLASRILGMMNQAKLSSEDQEVIRHFGELWTERISSSGMQDWSTLLLLQKLAAEEMDVEEKIVLANKLQKLMNNERRSNPNALSNPSLSKAFWENLER